MSLCNHCGEVYSYIGCGIDTGVCLSCREKADNTAIANEIDPSRVPYKRTVSVLDVVLGESDGTFTGNMH